MSHYKCFLIHDTYRTTTLSGVCTQSEGKKELACTRSDSEKEVCITQTIR